MSKLPEHVARNRAYWDDLARHYIEAGERAWAQEEPMWGIWQVPEAEVQVLSAELAVRRGVEGAQTESWQLPTLVRRNQ
jgi:hypothetical protein